MTQLNNIRNFWILSRIYAILLYNPTMPMTCIAVNTVDLLPESISTMPVATLLCVP